MSIVTARRPSDATGRPVVTDHVVQGHQKVSGDPGSMLTTILGSCVAACIWDPKSGVGGMNHFLLPGKLDEAGEGERLGVHAMELLINEMLSHGAAKRRLEAKVFGGANMNTALKDVGALNAAFARQFLTREGIAVVGECLGGRLARRVQFWPASGRARRNFLPDTHTVAIPPPQAIPHREAAAGLLELF